jgi:hypothetical protein
LCPWSPYVVTRPPCGCAVGGVVVVVCWCFVRDARTSLTALLKLRACSAGDIVFLAATVGDLPFFGALFLGFFGALFLGFWVVGDLRFLATPGTFFGAGTFFFGVGFAFLVPAPFFGLGVAGALARCASTSASTTILTASMTEITRLFMVI